MVTKRVNRQWLPADCTKDEWYTEYDMTFIFLNDIYQKGAEEEDIQADLSHQLEVLEAALDIMYSPKYFRNFKTLVSVKLTYFKEDCTAAEYNGLVEHQFLVRTIIDQITKGFGGKVSMLRLTASWGRNPNAIKILHEQDGDLHNPKDRSTEGQKAEVRAQPFKLQLEKFRPLYINYELLHLLFRDLVFDEETKRLRLLEITEEIPQWPACSIAGKPVVCLC